MSFIDDIMKKGKHEAARDTLPQGTVLGRFTYKSRTEDKPVTQDALAPLAEHELRRQAGRDSEAIQMGDSYVCDFCCARRPTREYDAETFQMLQQTTEALRFLGLSMKMNSIGGWRSCGECAELVDRENWRALASLVLSKHGGSVATRFDEAVEPLVIHFAEFARHARRDAAGKLAWKPYDSKKKIDLRETVLVRAQNVYDYAWDHAKEQGWEDLGAFTCAKPPFPKMVISWEGKKQNELFHFDAVVGEGEPDKLAEIIAGECSSPELELKTTVLDFIDHVVPDKVLIIKIYMDTVDFGVRVACAIDERGQVLIDRRANNAYIMMVGPKALGTEKSREAIVTEVLVIVLATLQFMNCKNVEVVDNAPTRQQRRAAERRGKKPPVTYKTLVIHPIGKRRAHREAAQSGAEYALHICRGHFKDFRSGPGLGKWHRHGLWWWSPQVRGRETEGRTVKDYEVRP